jgi:hypothetical protein
LARFAACDETLEDLPRSGRPRSDPNIVLITQLLTDDPYLSQKMIATILSISSTTVTKILLEDLSLRKVNFEWIPHRLSDDQKPERVRFSTELLQFLEARGPRKMTNVFTGMKHGFVMTIRAWQCGWAWTWSGRLAFDHQLETKS